MDAISSLIYCLTVTGIVVFKFAVDNALSVRTTLQSIKDCPGRLRLWIRPVGAVALALGTKFPRSGMGGYWGAKFSLYNKFGATSLASFQLWGAQSFFWIADAEALKLVASERHIFQKNIVGYEMMNMYGTNVVSTEGPEWKRHRSVAMSAFNEANVALVWSETLHVMEGWFAMLDAVGPDVVVDLLPTMTQAALFVIAAAGFDKRLFWTPESAQELPSGCKFTFHSAVVESVNNLIFKALIPGWLYHFSSLVKVPYLSSRVLLTERAFDDLRAHMLELVASARAGIASGKHHSASRAALLRNLVEANMNQDGESKKLTEGELLSNIFAFLLAGHETSAHTLCFAIVLLALHPDCQQKLYEEVIHVWHADVPATRLMANHREYIDKLEYTTACLRETLRMFPSEPRISKDVHADVVLPFTFFTPGSKDSPPVETGRSSMPVPAGSCVIIDIWSIHMNTLYWGEDAADFRPERFIDTRSYRWPRHAFMPFSIGARACMGQRFAYVEMIGILASIVRRYRILVPDDLAERPLKEQKEALLKWTIGVTLSPLGARVKLCRRDQ